MTVERHVDPILQEVLYTEVLPSGLTAYVLPRPGYQKKFATFATHYGSMDNTFFTPGADRPVSVPDGIAHFLEHKLFESEEKPVMQRFAALGASCNAFTNYTSTTYLFSTTENYEACLHLLLDFVQHPYITPENVEKEKGIIEQELRMYLDNPRWQVFHNLLQAVYHVHPVRIDIGGTVSSIRHITVDQLLLCYETFYHPDNMIFVAVGDVDPEATLAAVREEVEGRHRPRRGEIRRVLPEEPPTVRERWVVRTMPVAVPLVEMGFKEEDPRPDTALSREVLTAVALDALLGPSSALYQRLYERGLINDRFQVTYFAERNFGVSVLGGESPDPEGLVEEVRRGLAEAREKGMDAEAVDRIRRKAIGEFLALFDSPEAVATSFNSAHFKGYRLFDYLHALEQVRVEDVQARVEEHLRDDNWAVSIVRAG